MHLHLSRNYIYTYKELPSIVMEEKPLNNNIHEEYHIVCVFAYIDSVFFLVMFKDVRGLVQPNILKGLAWPKPSSTQRHGLGQE